MPRVKEIEECVRWGLYYATLNIHPTWIEADSACISFPSGRRQITLRITDFSGDRRLSMSSIAVEIKETLFAATWE